MGGRLARTGRLKGCSNTLPLPSDYHVATAFFEPDVCAKLCHLEAGTR